MNPTTNQIQNKSSVEGATLTEVLNRLNTSTGTASGDMTKAEYDTNNNGKVDAAEYADSVEWSGVQNKPVSFIPVAHSHKGDEVSVTSDTTPLPGAMPAGTVQQRLQETYLTSSQTASNLGFHRTIEGHGAYAIQNIPSGSISATDVQGAIDELDSEKFAKTGGDISGNVNIVGTGRRITADFSNVTTSLRGAFQGNVANSATAIPAIPNGTGTTSAWQAYNSSNPDNSSAGLFRCTASEVAIVSTATGSGTQLPLRSYIGVVQNTEQPTSGGFLVNGGALGYGVGAGGTVTQATSKSAAVTLNKPTGQITMNNAALGAGVETNFTLNNSTVAVGDNVIVVGTLGINYLYRTGPATAGAVAIFVKNNTAGSLSEAPVIDFKVIKGATS